MRALAYIICFAFIWMKVNSEKVGDLDLIDLDTLLSNNYLNEGLTLLVAGNSSFFLTWGWNQINKYFSLKVNEQKRLDEPHRTELNKLKHSIDEAQSVRIFATSDAKFSKKFSFLKFPQVVLYRNGRFIQYKGDWMCELWI